MSDCQKLNVDALIDGSNSIDDDQSGYFVCVQNDKVALHPARYFEQFFLLKSIVNGANEKDIIKRLSLTERQFTDFLGEELHITNDLAKKLESVSGISCDFWLRAQSKFDNTKN